MLFKLDEDEWGDLFTVGLGFVIGGRCQWQFQYQWQWQYQIQREWEITGRCAAPGGWGAALQL